MFRQDDSPLPLHHIDNIGPRDLDLIPMTRALRLRLLGNSK